MLALLQAVGNEQTVTSCEAAVFGSDRSIVAPVFNGMAGLTGLTVDDWLSELARITLLGRLTLPTPFEEDDDRVIDDMAVSAELWRDALQRHRAAGSLS